MNSGPGDDSASSSQKVQHAAALPALCSFDKEHPGVSNKTAMLPPKDDEPIAEIVVPSNFDVLFGRGRGKYAHPGNKRLQIMVNVYKDSYNTSSCTNNEKARIIDQIVKQIKKGGVEQGRFLKPDGHGGWLEVTDKETRTKVSHTLRYTRKSSHTSLIPEQNDYSSKGQASLEQVRINPRESWGSGFNATSSSTRSNLPHEKDLVLKQRNDDFRTYSSLAQASSNNDAIETRMDNPATGPPSEISFPPPPRQQQEQPPLLSDNEIFRALGYHHMVTTEAEPRLTRTTYEDDQSEKDNSHNA